MKVLLFCASLACQPKHTVAPTPEALVADVMERWEWTGVTAGVVEVDCGKTENAWYDPGPDQVSMCSSLWAKPDLAKWVLAHELSHAWMFEHKVPQRLGTYDQERSADELAFLMSDEDENAAAAKWFLGQGPIDDGVHPVALDRAGSILCLDAGREGWHPVCRLYFASVLGHWIRIFDGYQ